jgi:ribose transport system ATP-binding protein
MKEKQASILLHVDNVSKSFSGVSVLRHVSLSLRGGEVLGLIGENGAGKSTLMNILAGVVSRDSGRMRLADEDYTPRNPADALQKGIAFVHQELNLFANLTIAENLFLSNLPRKRLAGIPLIDNAQLRAKARALLETVALPLSPNTLLERLSQGERQLVEIAKALSVKAKVIIFDEPTTSLTARESERLFSMIERLRLEGIGIIYISHVLKDVFRLCSNLVILRDGEMTDSGPIGGFTPEGAISKMVGRNIGQLYPPRQNCPTSELLLEVRHLSQPGFLEDVNFGLHAGEIVGLAGLMGSGRSELARTLFGLEESHSGEILLKGNRLPVSSPMQSIESGLAFLTEDRREEGLLMELSLADNLGLVVLPSFTRSWMKLLDFKRLHREVEHIAEAVRLSTSTPAHLPVRNLSGGNQQKVVLGKWLLKGPSVFFLDEPTRGIDVGARFEIYKIINSLAEQGAALLIISSEIEELIGLCDRILVMRRGQLAGSFGREKFNREAILKAALPEG